MLTLALSTLLASTAGTLLGWAARLTARIAPLRPDPEPIEADEPERAVIPCAEDLPLRYALLLAGADMPEDEMPPGMQLAYMLAGARPLTGGSRCPVN